MQFSQDKQICYNIRQSKKSVKNRRENKVGCTNLVESIQSGNIFSSTKHLSENSVEVE